MDGRIYDILNKIDSLKIEKFGLSKDNRIYLKKLLIDEDFLNEQIKKYGNVDSFYLILSKIYELFTDLGNDFSKLSKKSENSNEVSDINKKLIKEIELIEDQKERVLNEYVSKEIDSKLDKKYNEDRISDILKKINN